MAQPVGTLIRNYLHLKQTQVGKKQVISFRIIVILFHHFFATPSTIFIELYESRQKPTIPLFFHAS